MVILKRDKRGKGGRRVFERLTLVTGSGIKRRPLPDGGGFFSYPKTTAIQRDGPKYYLSVP